MKLLKGLEKSIDFWFLITTSFVFFFLRLPSFFEPYWYGDEGVYEVLGFAVRHGRLLYQGIWDNKPPLLYLIYALFDGNQSYVRIFSCIVGLLSIYILFALSKLLFQNKKSVYISTAFFTIFLGLPLIEGNIANAENFMVLPILAGVYLLIRTIQEKKYRFLTVYSAGLFLGISFLIKVGGIFDLGTMLCLLGFVLFSWKIKAILQIVKQVLILSFGFLTPFLIILGFFATKGILKIFIQSAFASNVSYVSYGNQFLIPQGFLILKLLLLFAVILLVFVKKNSLSLAQLLIYLWIAFSLFNAFFSQRPYTHYMLTLLSSIALLIGLLFEKKWILHFLLFIGIFFLLFKNFWFYGKTTAYYENFLQFLTSSTTISAYQSFFDKGVPRDYAIADFLKSNVHRNQSVFLWTNSAQIYYLVNRLPLGRYTVAYHMTANTATLQETAAVLRLTRPDFIVILPNAPDFPFSMTDYRLRVTIGDGLVYEKIL